jgi:hypothetical protein
LNTRRSLNELEYVLNELSNIKSFYISSKSNPQIHLHHHHHHIYHHSTENYSKKYLNDNRSSPYDSQISLSLTGTGTTTTNDSSQGYHSVSTSSTVTNIEQIKKEISRTPLSFKNHIFHNNQHIDSDLSDDDQSALSNQLQTDSSKALYFINSLCVQPSKGSSHQQTLTHSSSQQSLQQQQPLFFLNNSYMTTSAQSLASSNIDIPLSTENSTVYSFTTNNEVNNTTRRQPVSLAQPPLPPPPPPKMGVKALNHTPTNKVCRMKLIISKLVR